MMARSGGSFDDFIKRYEDTLAGEDRDFYELKVAQFRLANELMERRKTENLTQQALSEITGIGQPEISRIESGADNPTVATLLRLAHGLKARVTISEDEGQPQTF